MMSRFKLNIPALTSLVDETLIREQASDRVRRPFVMLPINRIEPDPLQPRQTFSPESIQELAENIRANGLINPLTVRIVEDRYSLVCGERRHRACKVAGLTEVPCVVREMSDGEAMFLALTENILREDLNDIDRSRYLLRLKRDLDLTWGEIAKTLGLSEARVKQLAGLSSLPDELQDSVREGRLAGSAAQRIAAIQDDAVRDELTRKAHEGKLTRREVIRRIAVSEASVVSDAGGESDRRTERSFKAEKKGEPADAVRLTVLQRLFEFRRLVVSMNRLNEEEREEAELIREHLNRLLG